MVASNQVPLNDMAARAERIYSERLRAILEPTHRGEYVVINVDTGEYEVDADHAAASDRAITKHPATSLFAMRVGYRSLGRLGYAGPDARCPPSAPWTRTVIRGSTSECAGCVGLS